MLLCPVLQEILGTNFDGNLAYQGITSGAEHSILGDLGAENDKARLTERVAVKSGYYRPADEGAALKIERGSSDQTRLCRVRGSNLLRSITIVLGLPLKWI